jgi:peptidyl-prolyl cis-trans isomerase D
MLDSLRTFARSWIGKILGVFLLIGLAGFGIQNVLTSFGTNTVASVAGTDISVRDYQRAYDTQVNQVAQQMGQVPTLEQATAMGVPGMVLQRLAGEAVLNKLGNDLNLGVSDARLTEMLRSDPSFQNALGQFDATSFSRVLIASGFTQAEYRDLQTRAAQRQQLIGGLLGDMATPAASVELINRYLADSRTVDYFVLNAQALPPVAEPTDADLAAYLTEHQTEFRTKETRSIDMLALSPESIASTKVISDEEVAAEYERTKDTRVRIERRKIQQFVLSTPELEAAFTAGKAAGTPIADLVAANNVALQDLGTLSRAEVTDSALAAAAFDLALNDYVIIPGIGSQRVVTVSEIQPGGQITLDESREDIRRQLALTAARAEYGDTLDQIEELRAAFRPLTEIAQRFNLNLVSLDLTPGAPELSSDRDVTPEELSRLSSAIFGAEEGELTPTVTFGSNRNIFFDLNKIEPARDQTLDEVRDALATAWTNQKTAEALTAEVTRITEQLKSGTPFADVATSIGQFPILSPALKRDGSATVGGSTAQADPVLSADVAREIFNGGPTHYGSAINADGDYVVFQVVEVTPAPAPDVRASDFVENSIREGVYQDLVRGLIADSGIRTNQQVLTQLMTGGVTTPGTVPIQ